MTSISPPAAGWQHWPMVALAGNSADFVFPPLALYSVIRFDLFDVLATTASTALRLYLSSDGGASFDTSAGAYRWASTARTTNVANDYDQSAGAARVDLFTNMPAGASGGLNGFLEFRSLNAAQLTGGLALLQATYGATDHQQVRMNGFRRNVAALDNAMQLALSAADSFAAGHVQMSALRRL